MTLLIGSRALAHWDKNFKVKEDADWDIMTLADHWSLGPDKVELLGYLTARAYTNHHFSSGEYLWVNGVRVAVCNLRGLAAIKRSHLWRDYKFDKHITQYHKHLVDHLHPNDEMYISTRARATKAMVKQGNPSLRQSNKDFFDDAVTKVYDHDWLHELAAYGRQPAYLDMKKDFDLAWCEKDMWAEFPEEKKLQCVAEECYVIATERFLIPTNWDHSLKSAYFKSVQKVCTTLTSGWFRDYAIDNYPKIVSLFDKEKIVTMKEKIHEQA